MTVTANANKLITYSEIFGNTIQGEGQYTGVPTAWIRFYTCNLTCAGLGQEEPTKPETYDLTSNKIDLTNITDISELPVFERGCDSAYSVAKRYKHLTKQESVEQVVDRIQELLPNGKFFHPETKEPIHFAFTGGEPMLNQVDIIKMLGEFKKRDMQLKYITVESNGTRKIVGTFLHDLANFIVDDELEVMWSLSPKLHNTSGELNKKAIKPENAKEYYFGLRELVSEMNPELVNKVKMQLKFVVNGKQETWDELDAVLDQFKQVGVKYIHESISLWIMPVGGTLEGQEGKVTGHMSAGDVAEMGIRRGFRVAARVHNYLWANSVGK